MREVWLNTQSDIGKAKYNPNFSSGKKRMDGWLILGLLSLVPDYFENHMIPLSTGPLSQKMYAYFDYVSLLGNVSNLTETFVRNRATFFKTYFIFCQLLPKTKKAGIWISTWVPWVKTIMISAVEWFHWEYHEKNWEPLENDIKEVTNKTESSITKHLKDLKWKKCRWQYRQ